MFPRCKRNSPTPLPAHPWDAPDGQFRTFFAGSDLRVSRSLRAAESLGVVRRPGNPLRVVGPQFVSIAAAACSMYVRDAYTLTPGEWVLVRRLCRCYRRVRRDRVARNLSAERRAQPANRRRNMKAAIVQGAGQTPVYGDIAEPVPAAGENRITVTAAAISHVVKSRASGQHYSSSDQFPFVVGIDGVGRLDDGSRVYFVMPRAPYGSMAERTVAPSALCLPLPDELDDATAAAIANPGMSSWAAYTERAKLKPGESVLVNGATGTAGRLAVQIARHLGAGKIIATGRDVEVLRQLEALGADVTIPLTDDEAVLEASFREQFKQGVDVVIDYLWGKSAERLLITGAKAGAERGARPVRAGRLDQRLGHNAAERRAAFFGDRADGQRLRQHTVRPPRQCHPGVVAGYRARRFRDRVQTRSSV